MTIEDTIHLLSHILVSGLGLAGWGHTPGQEPSKDASSQSFVLLPPLQSVYP